MSFFIGLLMALMVVFTGSQPANSVAPTAPQKQEQTTQQSLESGITETTYEGSPAIVVDDVIYFSLFRTKHFSVNNDYISYDSDKKTIKMVSSDNTETIIDTLNPEDFHIYQDRSFLNVKYYNLLMRK